MYQLSQSEGCKRQLQYSSAKSKGNIALVLTLINIVYTAVTICLVIGLSVPWAADATTTTTTTTTIVSCIAQLISAKNSHDLITLLLESTSRIGFPSNSSTTSAQCMYLASSCEQNLIFQLKFA